MPHNGGHPASVLDALVFVLPAAAARGCVVVSPAPSSWAGPPPVGEFPEGVEAGLELRAQPEWVKRLILGGERGTPFWGEDAAGQQPPVGGLGAIIAFDHPGAVALFGHEFPDGLKEVHVEAQQLVDRLQCGERGAGAVAVVADVPAEHRAVPLLDIGLVVFAIGAAAGEGNTLVATPWHEDVVQELAAVVGVQAEQRHREGLPDGLHGAADTFVALAPHGLQFGPAVATSMARSEVRKKSWLLSPQCASKSACKWPGGILAHSPKVRSGTWARRAARLGLVVAMPRRRYCRRTGPKSRSMVAGLIRRRALRTSAERVISSCRSRVSSSSGRKGAKRLEHR